MTTVLLVRHGESEANKDNIFAGNVLNPDLSEKGFKQAALYAEYAVKNYKIDKVYSSNLLRAYNTAKACADLLKTEIIVDEGLREIGGGEWEGMTLDEIKEKDPEQFSIWCRDISACRCTGGESVAEMAERFIEALTKIARENDGKTILVASHYTPIRAMQAYAVKGDFREMQGFDHIPNTSITELYFDGEKWSAGEINICSYLNGLIGHIPVALKIKND